MKLVAALVAVPLLLAACGSGSGSEGAGAPGAASPEAALTVFLAGLEAGSCDDVKQVVVTPATVDCELVQSLGGSFAEEGIDLDGVSLDAGEVSGDSAVVTIDWGTDQADETWDVQRIDGRWRVLFDSEA